MLLRKTANEILSKVRDDDLGHKILSKVRDDDLGHKTP